jgi:replicative DNA helicase
LISTSDEICGQALNPLGKDTRQILDEAESRIFQISEEGARGKVGFQSLQDILSQVVQQVESLVENGGGDGVTGVPTGFMDLDQMTSGLQPGDLVIVAGRPSMGKTAFSLNIAEHVAINQGLPVAVFSMEMGASQLVMRMLCSVGRIDQQKVRTGRLADEDWMRLMSTMQKMQDAQLFIDETPGLNPLELRARARRLARQYGQMGLVVVDYLQLMSSSKEGENRATEISEISRSLKALAKELKCPVIALSQLNRSLEQRPDKRPVMSDLRESGAIEQDADVILFIYRDEVYDADSKDKGYAEIIIGKQRNGPIGRVRLTFVGQHTRFENAAQNFGESEY